jgi:hypothetical protein
MQIAIEIPDELAHRLETTGKTLDIVIIEALGLYMQHDSKIPEIDWAQKWEEWFDQCESIPTLTEPSSNNYTDLLINKYRQQGLVL